MMAKRSGKLGSALVTGAVGMILLSACGGGSGGLTQREADSCNAARDPLKPLTPALQGSVSSDVAVRLVDIPKVQDAAEAVAQAYHDAQPGTIKDAIRQLGLALNTFATDAVSDPDKASTEFTTLYVPALNTLNDACGIKFK